MEDKLDSAPPAVAFEVPVVTARSRRVEVPKRFRSHGPSKATSEDLDVKLAKADARRQAHINARLERIQRRRDECMRVDEAAKKLLQFDEWRRGVPGSENIQPMSRNETAQALRDIVHGMGRMESQLQKDIHLGIEYTSSWYMKSLEHGDKPNAIAFEVSVNALKKRHAPMPYRFRKQYRASPVSKESLEEKQKRAEERRAALIQARIERIQLQLQHTSDFDSDDSESEGSTDDSDESKPVAFDVSLGFPKKDVHPSIVPTRLYRGTCSKPVTTADLKAKLEEAAQRRDAHKQARLERIRKRTEDCKRLDKAVHNLLELNQLEGCRQEEFNVSDEDTESDVKDIIRDIKVMSDALKRDIALRDGVCDKIMLDGSRNEASAPEATQMRNINITTSPRRSSVAFEVHLDDGNVDGGPPERLMKHNFTRNHPVTVDELKAKLKRAEERRKLYKQAKIDRIKQRTEDCVRVDTAVTKLMQHEAWRLGYPGTEEMERPLTRKQRKEAYAEVMRGLSRIGARLQSDIEFAKKNQLDQEFMFTAM